LQVQAILDVYNIAGQKVQTLFNGHIDANETRIIDFKPTVANGMLIYTLRIGNQQVTGKTGRIKAIIELKNITAKAAQWAAFFLDMFG
jgi:hypothetical protein